MDVSDSVTNLNRVNSPYHPEISYFPPYYVNYIIIFCLSILLRDPIISRHFKMLNIVALLNLEKYLCKHIIIYMYNVL